MGNLNITSNAALWDKVVPLGANLRKRRLALNLSQREVVDRLVYYGIELTYSTYCRLEMGNASVSVLTLVALCSILQCDPNALFSYPDVLEYIVPQEDYTE